MAAVPETEIVLLPLVVVPVIGVTGMMLPRRSVKLLLVVAMLLQLMVPLLSALPTLTVVTYGTTAM